MWKCAGRGDGGSVGQDVGESPGSRAQVVAEVAQSLHRTTVEGWWRTGRIERWTPKRARPVFAGSFLPKSALWHGQVIPSGRTFSTGSGEVIPSPLRPPGRGTAGLGYNGTDEHRA